ncbi:hypothetical protein M23134_04907 [Microscilla marina ATCC 23134]|uniref:Uncharacterized protein n=1 Tax=Microscilla marina ATCC 23134 TaxID=313606 RepID=A1ZV77_MICM2|nr:hypothetical protein M23134_04907 [Microscilla marina ATCC 23134]
MKRKQRKLLRQLKKKYDRQKRRVMKKFKLPADQARELSFIKKAYYGEVNYIN